MDRILYLYDKDDFFDYKAMKFSEGYSIVSISKFIKDNELIQDLDVNSEIVDLSVLTEYQLLQLLPEQIIPLFDEETIFIADKKYKNHFIYELRFLFNEFKETEKSHLKSEVQLESSENKTTTKRHKKIIDLEENELNQFFENFRNKLYGHPKFKDDFENQIRTFRIFNKLKEHKILSLFLLGDSGVGKTEVARTIHKCLEGEKPLAKINFGNYSNEFSLSSLIGASRGYRDSEDGEIFMKVRDADVGILLIDEFEKSNTTLFNYFLNVLETGIIEGSLGQQIDLNGFIIIFTSNISKDDFPKRISPELRSRFDYKCQFTLLNYDDKIKYIEFRVRDLVKKVKLEFGVDLPENTIDYFLISIDVNKYSNMRDINNKIKMVFLDYLKTEHQVPGEVDIVENSSSFSLTRRFLNLFKS